jgi:hypothetical protein
MNRQDLIDMGAIKPDQEVETVSPWAIIGALAVAIVLVTASGMAVIGLDPLPVVSKCR